MENPVKTATTKRWAALGLGAFSACLMVLTASGPSHAEGESGGGSAGARAEPKCSEAVALLAGSTSGDHDRIWAAVGSVVKKDKRYEIVEEMPRNVVGKVTFRQWTVKNAKGGAPTTMYAAHCGHGGTCNRLANDFKDAYPKMQPTPIVHCGDVSNVLENPVRGSL